MILHFKRILINGRWDLRRGFFGACLFGLLFRPFCLGPPFEEFQEMADFGVFAKLAIARNSGHFCSRGLRQNVVQWLHFERILIKWRWDLRGGVVWDCEFGLLFWPFCLGPPFEECQKMADYAVFAKLATARNCGHFYSRSLKQNVVQWLHFKRILINGRWDLRRGVFWACEFVLLFRLFCLGLPFEEFQKMADFVFFAKLAIARNCGHFCSRGLKQNVVQWLHFKRILINGRWDLLRGVFGACEFGLLFWPFCLGPPFKTFKKMADFGVVAKLAIARNCGHFCSRGLRQNFVQWLHFERILINGRWDLRRGVFGACEFGLLFRPFCLGPPFWRISKNGLFWCFCKIGHSSELRALFQLRFEAECYPMIAL